MGEETKTNNEKDKSAEHPYRMKGIPLNAYLAENGEFQWVPSFESCCNKENARAILEVLRKLPPERRAVWVKRLDLDEAIATCPVIRAEADLCKQFDELCMAYGKLSVNKSPDKKVKGGESIE